MIKEADIFITAWNDNQLIGIARSVTDFAYCCYLSDLAVDQAWQRRGIGKKLIQETASQLEPTCQLILLSAPAATEYYPAVGFHKHPSAWVVTAEKFNPGHQNPEH